MTPQKFYAGDVNESIKANEQVSKLIEESSDKSLMVEPGTVIAAFETGKRIYDLFGKKKNNDELIKYLKKELTYIKRLLKDVIDRLEELKVLISNQSREYTVNKLDSILDIFEVSYETWWKYPNRDDVKREVAEIFSKLREYIRVAERYGYAHYNSVWIGVIHELILLEYYGRPKKEIKDTLKQHLPYFTAAISTNIPGSITNSLNRSANNILKLSQSLPAFSHTNKWNKTEGQKIYYYEQTLTIKGDLIKGFSIEESSPKLVKTENDYWGGRHLYYPKAMELYSNIDFKKTRSNYEKQRTFYLTYLLPEYKELNDAKLSIDNYIKFINLLITKYTD